MEDVGEVSIFEAGDPTSKKLQYAVLLGERLEVKSVSQLYVVVLERLFNLRPELFFTTHLGTQVKLTKIEKSDTLIKAALIDDKYVIEVTLNSENKFDRIKAALTVFSLENGLKIKYSQQIDSDALLDEFLSAQ